jgi:hypothetical protein
MNSTMVYCEAEAVPRFGSFLSFMSRASHEAVPTVCHNSTERG